VESFHLRLNPRVDSAGSARADTRGMPTNEYVLDAALVLAVVRQLRGRRLEGFGLYLPLALVTFAAVRYLHSLPTGRTDLILVSLGVGVGLALGVLAGIYTHVYRGEDGAPFARATSTAAGLWIVGVGARMAFSLYARHGGGPSLARFSHEHALAMQAWVDALVLMALCEVVSRSILLVVRSRRLPRGGAIIRAT
jgi:hypothetical protein